MSKKDFTTSQLEKAWKKGKETYAGAARELGISPNTFKAKWQALKDKVTAPSKQKKKTNIETPGNDGYVDEKVKALVDDYHKVRENTRQAIVLEMVQKIECLRSKGRSLLNEADRIEEKLREMYLE